MKSNVSDQIRLAECIYRDACAKCSADVFDLRDLETLRSRVEHEGLSFLTITLPQFAKDFERSLHDGQIDSKAFQSFRKTRSIPSFLKGMVSQVFDWKTGRICHELQPEAASALSPIIEGVRQICLAFKKLEIACTPEREQAAFDNFKTIEHEVREFSLRTEEHDTFSRVSRVLWSVVISNIKLSDCNPKHGPGVTAERVSGNRKYAWLEWADRLEPYFPLIGNGYPLGTPAESEELEKLSIMPMGSERPVRVVSVPKTLKSPRIIAIEPCCMQFSQQGIREQLYAALESYWLTKGHVNFRDQSINQKLAISASATGRLATIDLSDASDRVPRDLALEMFQSNPDLRDAIDACRSDTAQLPSGEIISPLLKFASMGSALCFPVEAMYFYTICVVALLEAQNLPVTRRNIYKVSRGVYVYGDDIIVPTTYADSVLAHLQKYNCKVNVAKTFYRGSFRESCGVDAWMGEEVTPTYVHSLHPKDRRQYAEIVSWVSTANLFYRKGYWQTTLYMRKHIERVVGVLPYVSETSPALGHISFLGYQSAERWNDDLQRLEIKALVPSPVYRTDRLEGYAALAKSLLGLATRKESPFPGGTLRGNLLGSGELNYLQAPTDCSLERSALHGAVTLKRRWVPSLT